MKLKWDESAWEEYTEIQARDKQMLKRINMLVKDAMRSPFEGIGKPEGLKWKLAEDSECGRAGLLGGGTPSRSRQI